MRIRKRKGLLIAASFVTAASLVLAGCSGGSTNTGNGSKGKIYLNLSYSGNNWQDQAANLAMSVAESPEVQANYSVQKVISGSDPQKQISDIQSMIASGAKLIVFYPISPTALNPVIKQGCDAGVTFVAYDGTVEEPCAYNVSYITGARADNPEQAFFGAQTAQGLVDLLGGQGKIMLNRGVAGTSTDIVHYDSAKAVFDQYPGIQIVTEYYGNWDSSVSQQETAKALAAHPDIDGVWSELGEDGVVKALQAAGMKVPVTGEDTNYFRKMLSQGWPGVSSGSPPASGGIAMKVGLKILADGPNSVPHDIEINLPYVTTDTAKACPGSEFVDGCNFFTNAADQFVTEVFDPALLPESSYTAAMQVAPFDKLVPLPDMSSYAQPEWRRIYTRGSCDAGWKEGPVTTGQVPPGLDGCVQA
ncbi:MAG: sugar ABC transporter substrate-binding protein [Propionibacteriaceae bacterium]|nr:sugar ABC transporter substrate-binding protein [Propionibacteriaceae bacterium]